MAFLITNVLDSTEKTYSVIKAFRSAGHSGDGTPTFDVKPGDTVTGILVEQGFGGSKEPLTKCVQIKKPDGSRHTISAEFVDINNPQSEINWYLYGGIAVAAIVGIYLITRKK